MNLTSFLIYCVVVTITPGPTNIVILSSVQHFGARKTMQYVYGATIAFGLLLATSSILNRILVEIIPNILSIMRIIGGFYMLYLAYQIYQMGSTETKNHQPANFVSGLLMQFVNPKVLLFTVTVIPSYVLPYYTSSLASFLFVIIISVIGFLAFTTWVIFGTIFRSYLQNHQKVINVLMALFLVYSAILVSGIL
ncbi:LysE family translocator [Paenibacillus crassostreae]|uniref:Lysine transporter LysE n=1 Tax=Paenibacillus crassostreae TaxID=1763538 RepID=A0A167DP76_9BACL|nr:LysE family transporter [Paenibacillus crassostreae]AOZ91224.1 lysine transporter LysE [Paenibacillus crassostreae]OAB74618.1 lysine transporter LysE [Paenibacillus crassostreae]